MEARLMILSIAGDVGKQCVVIENQIDFAIIVDFEMPMGSDGVCNSYFVTSALVAASCCCACAIVNSCGLIMTYDIAASHRESTTIDSINISGKTNTVVIDIFCGSFETLMGWSLLPNIYFTFIGAIRDMIAQLAIQSPVVMNNLRAEGIEILRLFYTQGDVGGFADVQRGIAGAVADEDIVEEVGGEVLAVVDIAARGGLLPIVEARATEVIGRLLVGCAAIFVTGHIEAGVDVIGGRDALVGDGLAKVQSVQGDGLVAVDEMDLDGLRRFSRIRIVLCQGSRVSGDENCSREEA